MERQLRLAERQGLLKGASLSRVQQFGLELLILADGWAQSREYGERFEERVKLALVAAGRDPLDLWSEPAPQSYEDFDPATDEGRDFDYSAVSWQESSEDEWERMQRALSSTRVQVSGKPDAPVSDVPDVPDVDFDREWQ